MPCTRLSCLHLHPHSHAVCGQYGLQACLYGVALTSPYLDALESLHWLGSYKHRVDFRDRAELMGRVPVLGNCDISRSARAMASTSCLC